MVSSEEIKKLVEFIEKGNNVIIYNGGGLIADIKNPEMNGSEYFISISNELAKVNIFTDVIQKIKFEDGCAVIEIKRSDITGSVV